MELRRGRRGTGSSIVADVRNLQPVCPACAFELGFDHAVARSHGLDHLAVSDIHTDVTVMSDGKAGRFRDRVNRAGNGCGESLPRPGTALHRAARTDRYAKHPHRHGVCHASQTPRIHTARASAGGAYMGYATNKRNGRI